MSSNRITIVYHIPTYRQQGQLYCNGAFGRFVDEIAKHFGEVILCVPSQHETPKQPEYSIQACNVHLCPLPPFDTFAQLLIQYPRILYILLRNIPRWDLVCLRIPTYYGFFAYVLARIAKRPIFLLVVGDTREVYRSFAFRGMKKWFAQLWVEFLEITDTFMVRRSLTLVNGDGLLRKYRHLGPQIYRTATASIRETEVLPARIRPVWPEQIRLLYVGRLYPEKGLGVLLQSLHMLRSDGVEMTLTIVGDGKYQGDLEARAKDLRLESWVEFRGHIPFGDLLFQIYQASDIFVLPSLSEGLPRVLGEAMSQGLPIVASRVGGIPGFVRDRVTGMLVEPSSPESLTATIRELVGNPALARHLVTNGLEWAREHTVERHVRDILDKVRTIIHEKGTLSR